MLLYRLAKIDDVPAIFDVLEEAASEIPLCLADERRDLILDHIRRCCEFGATQVAVAEDKIIGVLLAEPDQLERFHNNNEVIHLPYGSVRKNYREQHIFPTLVRKVQSNRVPLTATVNHANKGDMVSRLERLGFIKLRPDERLCRLPDDEDHLRWEPPLF